MNNPLRNFNFFNKMSKNLFKQVPWIKFYRNTSFSESKANEGLIMHFEHEKNWYSGINDDQIEKFFLQVTLVY